MNKKILKYNGWQLILDKSEVIADDPGAGTPAIVESPTGVTGTYWCALDTGEVGGGDVQIPRGVAVWLDRQVEEVEEFLFGEAA